MTNSTPAGTVGTGPRRNAAPPHSRASREILEELEWRVYPDTVREMLGHESITMAMGLYGHLMENAQADAIRALREIHRRPEELAG